MPTTKEHGFSSLISGFVIFLAFFLVMGCGTDDSRKREELSKIKETLFMRADVIPGEKGDTLLSLKLDNVSDLALSLGTDVLVWTCDPDEKLDAKPEIEILARSDPSSLRAERNLMFSIGADWLLGYTANIKTRALCGCDGQEIVIENGSSCGDWLSILGAGKKMAMQVPLMTEAKLHGWVAGPVVETPGGAQGRILLEFGSHKPRSVFVGYSRDELSVVIDDKSLPAAVRRWAAVWLASMQSDDGRRLLSGILGNSGQPFDVCCGSTAGLAIYDSPKGLAVVNDAMWRTNTSEELRRFCFFCLTWSEHAEAKRLISKAVDHPDSNISRDARALQ